MARNGPPVRRFTRPAPAESSLARPGVTGRKNVMQREPVSHLRVSAPNDRFEREADRVADRVMGMPAPPVETAAAGTPPPVQTKCAACAAGGAPCPACAGSDARLAPTTAASAAPPLIQRAIRAEDEELVQPKRASGADHASRPVPANVAAGIAGLRGGGAPLPDAARSYFEPRFGRDFSGVRVHTGTRADGLSKALNARAFTTGADIAFARGQYAPETMTGRRLVAHELAHVAQQNGPKPAAGAAVSVHNRLPAGTVAGDWIIENPKRKVTAGGKTDAELTAAAFSEICDKTQLNGDRIVLNAGPVAANRVHGCACLQDIENDLAAAKPVLKATPHVKLVEKGWSFSNSRSSPPLVAARHPAGEFEWGYWTGGQTRRVKEFWQTMAHEVCGHIATFVRTGGAHAGGRASGFGHNPAIEGENLVASEHGVPPAEERGLDVDPGTKKPLPGHRGESFLQAGVRGFAHASDGLPASSSKVVDETAATVKTVKRSLRADLFAQVEGFAYGNEGAASMARKRAEAVRQALETKFKAQSISLDIVKGKAVVPRFSPDQATVLTGASAPNISDSTRRVHVYLFHKRHSAGP